MVAAMRRLALVRGDYLIEGEPQILRLWRIITPGLSLVYLLVFLPLFTLHFVSRRPGAAAR